MKSSINSQQSSEMGYVITDHLVNETRLLQACAAKAVGRINPFGRSVWALANENGGFIEQYAYDGCCSFVETCAAGLATKRNPVQAGAQRRFRREGNRRDQHNWGVSASSTPGTVTDRGFTGHEHLENFGLIHMPRLLSGGRVYDPLTMQFLSPDPFIQAQGMSANYNRYSYCMNNPLSFTDPSGYIIESMSLPDAIDYLYNHTENGGTWYNTGGGGGSVEVFDSQDDAFEAGVGYINSFGADAWSETEYGSEDKTRLAYKIKSVDFTRLTGYFSYKGYKFFFTISKGKWYIPNSNIEVTDFTSQILHDYSLLVDGANSNSKTGNNAANGGGYYEDPMFYINGGIGVASTGATIKGGYHLSNELYHYTRSSGNLHFRGGKYWNNPFVNNSKAAIAARGGAWRSAGTKLGYAGIAITTGDALMSGEFRTSQGINVAMTTLAIAVPGVGSIVAGVYFVADIGLTLSTGRGIGDRIDAATGGTHELYNGLY